jgi:glycosyltransferase involved in cell wall biosynthesis
MNTCVCSTRTSDVDFMIEELAKCRLKLALNRSKLRLNLPTVEVCAVVRDSQLEVPHMMAYSTGLGGPAMPGITGTVITFNEEGRIADALASLSCCDEVLVVDSRSTDQTRDIARTLGARVIEREWQGYSNQKNFAAEQATNDWILSIDADERLSVELADEIVRWKKSVTTGSPVAWSMPRRAFYLGRWIGHSGWYPDRKIRLYDKRHCHWEGDFVHERVKVNGDIGRFLEDLLHIPYRNWHDHEKRIDRYTELAAQAARSTGLRGNIFKLVLVPPFTFIRSFILRAGFLDGWRGLAIAYMGARYVFQREFRILR